MVRRYWLVAWVASLFLSWHVPLASGQDGVESVAERIARLKRSLREDEQLLKELKARLEDPESSYRRAEKLFERLDGELEALRKQRQEAQEAGDARRVEELDARLKDLEEQWRLAKKAFDAEIQNRRLLQERIRQLGEKIEKDRAALAILTGDAQSPEETDAAAGADSEPAEGPVAEVAEDVAELRRRVDELRQQLELAEDRLRASQKLLEEEQNALKAARAAYRDAVSAFITLQEELRKTVTERIGEANPERLAELDRRLQQLSEQLEEAERRVRQGREATAEHEQRIERLREEVQLTAQEVEALRGQLEEAEAALAEAERKQYWLRKVVQLLGLRDWIVEHGPRILGIIVGALILWWVVRLLERRLLYVVLQAARKEEEDEEERLNRARTLTGFFRHAAGLVILGGAAVLILSELGVNLNVMLGGAAITGLAAAFAGQNLLRDYFSGFVILLENQYGVNDVVKIGDLAGIVEKVTLRLTVLRSLDGTVHFIPNGQIASVSNMTHGWSRALFDIEVSYNEDLDRVMQVLMELAKEMKEDPEYGEMILGEPEMLGVDEFRESGIAIKFFLKTRPLRQWAVKRELLRRIKRRFDELGIEIPYPHRTVYHRFDEADPLIRLLEQTSRQG